MGLFQIFHEESQIKNIGTIKRSLKQAVFSKETKKIAYYRELAVFK